MAALSNKRETSAASSPESTATLQHDGVSKLLKGLDDEAAKELSDLFEVLNIAQGRAIIQQNHEGKFLYFLLKGEVRFHLLLATTDREFSVGYCGRFLTPIGWSVFRAPGRYATGAQAESDVLLMRLPVDKLSLFFERYPPSARTFLSRIESLARPLLQDAREHLLRQLGPHSATYHWSTQMTRRKNITRDLSRRAKTILFMDQTIPSEEGMVTNAAPAMPRVLKACTLFHGISDSLLACLSEKANISYFCRGDVIKKQGTRAAALSILADGRLRVEYSGKTGLTAVIGFETERGTTLCSGMSNHSLSHDITIRATRDGSILNITDEDLEDILVKNPDFGVRFERSRLSLLSQDLRRVRARVLSESFDGERLAVENMIEQARSEISISSSLHKLPHLLRASVTRGDALSVLDSALHAESHVERNIAQIASELLLPLRKEEKFYRNLENAFETVAQAPLKTKDFELKRKVRRQNAESFLRIFSEVATVTRGLEYLPREPGHLFIFNHLKNHECNTLPNGFQMTLDAHFISSMILYRFYGDPGLRVVRKSRAGEYGHHSYYEKLGHLSVYTPESDAPGESRSDRFEQFVVTARAHIEQGYNLVIAPEGTSYCTELSPGPFRSGAFRLAALLKPSVKIVPISVAHFDRRVGHTAMAATIHPSFSLKERLKSPEDPAAMALFLRELRDDYRTWVQQTAELAVRENSSQAERQSDL